MRVDLDGLEANETRALIDEGEGMDDSDDDTAAPALVSRASGKSKVALYAESGQFDPHAARKAKKAAKKGKGAEPVLSSEDYNFEADFQHSADDLPDEPGSDDEEENDEDEDAEEMSD